jgi:UDP-2-acetamido-3-amino-2,3-dideoxy-glucuronate N-acetyltransferase
MTATKEFFIHPTALCESTAVGARTRIWAFAHVMAGARIGKDCNIGDHAFVESGARLGHGVTIKNQVLIWEGVTIGDGVFVGPAVIFTNDRHPRSPRLPGVPAVARRYSDKSRWLLPTRVGRGASIGAGAIILPGIVVGEFALIAAGSVVTADVPPHAIVAGNPARGQGWVCPCGQRAAAGTGRTARCHHCGRGDRRRIRIVPTKKPRV